MDKYNAWYKVMAYSATHIEFVFAGPIIGNLISSSVLMSSMEDDDVSDKAVQIANTSRTNLTYKMTSPENVVAALEDLYSTCGPSDCPAGELQANITNDNFQRPEDKVVSLLIFPT